MKYCPSCKAEYEDSATMCGDCKIDLVDSILEAKLYKQLLKIKKSELEKLEEYLKYSGIEDYRLEEEEETALISVPEESFEKAYKYVAVYISENMSDERNEDDYFFDEYKTEKVGSKTEVNDMKGSVLAFLILGVALLAFSILSFLGVINSPFTQNKLMLGVAFVFGLVSLYTAFNTKKKIQDVEKDVEIKEGKINSLLDEFKDKFDLDTYLEDKSVDLESEDDGAKYFIIFDLIKVDLRNMYPDEAESIINSVADQIYEILNKK